MMPNVPLLTSKEREEINRQMTLAAQRGDWESYDSLAAVLWRDLAYRARQQAERRQGEGESEEEEKPP